MNSNRVRRAGGAWWFVVTVVVFLAAAVYVIGAVYTDSDLGDASDDMPLLILGVAGVISLAGWWRDRARRSKVDEEVQRERARLESEIREHENALRESREQLESAQKKEAEQRQAREQLESKLNDQEKTLARERYLRSRSEEAHQAEKNWRQELHTEIMRMSRERGPLGDPSNVPSMVLRLARTLLGAEKGLLLWGRDKDGDGRFDLAAAEGFEQDPESSAIAQRFAGEVLESGKAVREQNPGEVDAGQRAGSDEEIENLVAVPIYLQDEFGGVVVCANNPDGFDDYDDEVLLSVGDQAGAVLQNARLQGELRSSYLATVSMLADALEIKDPVLRGHSEEVSGYVAAVADRFDLPQRRREELLFGSLLHDIGKIGISELILLKPGTLTPEERSVIELHPRIGYQLVEQVPALRPISPAILHHHERYDGEGYPSGLGGVEIPLEARIICVADAFSAMISERPYRERMTFDDACAELERHAGTQFDPEIVRLFVEEVRRKPPISERQDLAEALRDPESEAGRGDETVLGYRTLALIDNLTLLYTRRYFHETAHAEARQAEIRGRPFGVVLVELTELAQINWREGYASGDEAIRVSAHIVQQAATRHDGTAYRHGGNRLGLIVPDADEQAAGLLADEILVELRQGPSVRVATAAWRPGDDGEAVVARARARLG
jgi:diguanylate cyclase (GGDEF)-like protein